ncbi:hypothetical protein PVAP13_9KG060557 [Panicum virgatum]|uniref:Uncharacterized protein n=1 Tax=Panicum virgatum TaxID=38727 RepID=A0A8T0NFH1_PANVG|nr:hypothetical protein PVAP13_9KG060557 [Panicum virgatum]
MGLLAPLLCDVLVIAGQGSNNRINCEQCWPMDYYVIYIHQDRHANFLEVSIAIKSL